MQKLSNKIILEYVPTLHFEPNTQKTKKKKPPKRKKKNKPTLVVLMYSNHVAESWVISWLRANKDHLSVSHPLITFHRLSAAHPICGEGERDQPPFSTDYSLCGHAETGQPPQDDQQGAISSEKKFQTLLSHSSNFFGVSCSGLKF